MNTDATAQHGSEIEKARQAKIIIVGGGPAGLGTALHLVRRMPHLASDILVLEAKEHPRHKLCGGGVTFHGEQQLKKLGLQIDVPAFVVNRLLFRLGSQTFTTNHPHAMRITQRSEFDAALARAVAQAGLTIHSNERLLEITPEADSVQLRTTRAAYQAEIVIAADGANSTVRQKLKMFDTVGIARLLRVMTPIEPAEDEIWQRETAVFDFSCVLNGIQGYSWDFPCVVDGQPHMNRGIFDSRIDPEQTKEQAHGHLKNSFVNSLAPHHVDWQTTQLKGHPVRWFNPQATFSHPRILLVGDAAGVDPLFAEGISFALEYGEIAAAVIQEALKQQNFSFASYKEKLLSHRLGKLLYRRTLVAKSLYRYQKPRFWQLLWRCAAIAPVKVQRLMGASLGLLPP